MNFARSWIVLGIVTAIFAIFAGALHYFFVTTFPQFGMMTTKTGPSTFVSKLADPFYSFAPNEIVGDAKYHHVVRRLMPAPSTVTIIKYADSDHTLPYALKLDPHIGFMVTTNAINKVVDTAISTLKKRLEHWFGRELKFDIVQMERNIDINKNDVSKLDVDMNENYSLHVDKGDNDIPIISVEAPTSIGIARSFQTLSQLIKIDDQKRFGEIFMVAIDDSPRFKWRGLMIDVCRHFIPKEKILVQLEAMAAMKLNVLHLHLSEDQGWRIESQKYPKLQEKGGEEVYFTREDIKEIVAFAMRRGIRVVPEIDLPGHVTSLLFAYPELGSQPDIKIEEPMRTYGISDNCLDVSNEKVYEFLKDLFTELVEIFPDEYFHIGGDEVTLTHWKTNDSITKFMKDNNLKNYKELHLYFTHRLQAILKGLGKKTIGWSEIYHPNLSTDITVQEWLKQPSLQNHFMVYSRPYYLDWNSYSIHYYSEDPGTHSKLLGCEACMWTEYVAPHNVDAKIWPSMALIAEKFWSSRQFTAEELGRLQRMVVNRMDFVNMYLESLEFGLTHRSCLESILEGLVGGLCTISLPLETKIPTEISMGTSKDHQPLVVLANVLKNENRVQTAGYTTLKPLTDLIDAIAPQSTTVKKFHHLVDAMLTGNTEVQKLVRTCLEEWIENDKQISELVKDPENQNSKLIVGFSYKLKQISQCALNALAGEKDPSLDCAAAFEAASKAESKIRIDIVPSLLKIANRKET